MIKALIFDFDGLIVDTETPALKAWQSVYEEQGHHLDHSDWTRYFLTDSFDPAHHLLQLSEGRVQLDAIINRRDLLKTELCNAQQLLPGVRSWIDEAKKLSLKIGVSSSSRRPWVTGHLERCDVLDRFDVITTREDVERAKPAPDLFLLTASLLGVEAPEILVIEDSPNGLKAAYDAGMNCLVVPNELTRLMTFLSYGWRMDSLAQSSLQAFLEKNEIA